MDDATPPRPREPLPRPPAARRLLRLAALGIAIYAANVLAGKGAALAGIELPLRLGDIGEFLLVLASSALFVTALMLTEPAQNRTPD